MCEPSVNIGSEHVGHGTTGGLAEAADVALQGWAVDGAQFGPLDTVEGVDQVHKRREVPERGRAGERVI